MKTQLGLGEKSMEKLSQCHPDLIKLFQEVAAVYPITILEGHRSKESQDEMFRTGKSKLQWPDGKHNKTPSEAVDAAPYPIDWNDRARFYHMAGFVLATAHKLGIKIRWGGDWDKDLDFKDQSFFDLPHFELVTE